jgi:hypothetical protein
MKKVAIYSVVGFAVLFCGMFCGHRHLFGHRHASACGGVVGSSFVGSNFVGYADPGCGGAVASFAPQLVPSFSYNAAFTPFAVATPSVVVVNNNRRFFGNRVNVNAPGVHVRVR